MRCLFTITAVYVVVGAGCPQQAGEDGGVDAIAARDSSAASDASAQTDTTPATDVAPQTDGAPGPDTAFSQDGATADRVGGNGSTPLGDNCLADEECAGGAFCDISGFLIDKTCCLPDRRVGCTDNIHCCGQGLCFTELEGGTCLVCAVSGAGCGGSQPGCCPDLDCTGPASDPDVEGEDGTCQ